MLKNALASLILRSEFFWKMSAVRVDDGRRMYRQTCGQLALHLLRFKDYSAEAM